MTTIDKGTIDYKSELLRKSIHLCSLSIPIVYNINSVTKEFALSIMIPLTVISIIIDVGRHNFISFSKIFNLLFGFLLRDHEKDNRKKNLSGATYVLISAVVVILVFPKVFVITGFTVLILSDISAALIGRRYGKHKFLAKSLEGTLAFFVVGCVVVLFVPKVQYDFLEYLIGFVAVGVGAFVENISYGWADDNLTIPVSIGFIMWLLYLVIYPELNLTLLTFPN